MTIELTEAAARAFGIRRSLFLRFADNVMIDDGCWEWAGGRSRNGYATVNAGGSKGATLLAHRVGYELLVAPIGGGMVLDHLCRNRGCVRPDHLEPVTQRENILRGTGLAAINAQKTHCDQGHEFSEANTRVNNGHRHCRICVREKQRRYRRNKR